MLRYYRGHVIVLLQDETLSAEITEQRTGTPLPTKVTGAPEDGAEQLMDKARALIDAYLHHPSS